ncbi:MAG: hypothetical protein NTV22_13045 [bacterium]|nr:hypothetical protein [bacterium]
MKVSLSLAAALAMAVCMSAGIAKAADFTWTNAATANQDWFGSGNWSPNGVPNNDSDTAILGEIDTYASSRVLYQHENATVSVIRVESKTNIWQITVDEWWGGKLMVLKAASGNAVIDVKNFAGTDPGGYYGNLRIGTGAGMLRFESDTDITVTNDSIGKAYLVTPLPLAGGVTVNKYGNGQWTVENPDSPLQRHDQCLQRHAGAGQQWRCLDQRRRRRGACRRQNQHGDTVATNAHRVQHTRGTERRHHGERLVGRASIQECFGAVNRRR